MIFAFLGTTEVFLIIVTGIFVFGVAARRK